MDIDIHKPLDISNEGSRNISYRVYEVSNIFGSSNDTLYNAIPHGPENRVCFLAIDRHVYKALGESIVSYFRQRFITVHCHVLCGSEQSKQIDQALNFLSWLDQNGISRRSEPVIAIGGGVVLDIVGFACSIYRRGIPYIRVPTTLLSFVDASVGVKTGINFNGGRNRLGSYYPPVATYLDKSLFESLDRRQMASGAAEIIKVAVMTDHALFDLLEENLVALLESRFQPPGASDAILRRAVVGMIRELEQNFWEEDLDRLMDFGHSFSPRLEKTAHPQLLHGEAVAIDVALSTALALIRGSISMRECERILELLASAGLPLSHPLLDYEYAFGCLEETSLHRGGRQRVPLPTGIGKGKIVNNISMEELIKAIDSLGEWCRNKGIV